LRQIRLDVQNERVLAPVRILVHQHARTLVQKQNVLVFIENGKLRLDGIKRPRILFGQVEKLFFDKKFHRVALTK